MTRLYILRNAMPPIVTLLWASTSASCSGGAIFMEQLSSVTGASAGSAILALDGFDLLMVMGIMVFATIAVIICTDRRPVVRGHRSEVPTS